MTEDKPPKNEDKPKDGEKPTEKGSGKDQLPPEDRDEDGEVHDENEESGRNKPAIGKNSDSKNHKFEKPKNKPKRKGENSDKDGPEKKRPSLKEQAQSGASDEKGGDALPPETKVSPYSQATLSILKAIEDEGKQAVENDPVIVPLVMKNIYPCHDYELILRKVTKPRKECAPTIEITVQPDFSKIFLVIVSRVCKTSELWTKTLLNYVSRPTLIGFCMMQVYVWMIVSELETSEEKSAEAKEWASDPNKVKLLELVKNSPTLNILDDIYSALMPTTLTNGVRVIPSFKAFSFKHDILTIIPIHTFMHLHNVVTTMATNEKQLYMEMVTRHQPLCEISCGVTGGNIIINIGTMSGRDYNEDGFDNAMKAAFDLIVHFGGLRGTKRTSDTQEYSFTKCLNYNMLNFNAIDYAMSCDTTNLRAAETIVRNTTKYLEVANFAASTIKDRLKSRKFNNDILQHTIVPFEQPCGYIKHRGFTYDKDIMPGDEIPKTEPQNSDKYANFNSPVPGTLEWTLRRIHGQHSKRVVSLETWNAKRGNLQSLTNYFARDAQLNRVAVDDIRDKYIHNIRQQPFWAEPFTAGGNSGCNHHRGLDLDTLHVSINESIYVDPGVNPANDVDPEIDGWNLKPRANQIEAYSERKHHRPKCIAIQTFDGNKNQAIRSAMYGLIIKNLSVDGYYKHVPQPSSCEDFEACRISDAAVRMSNCMTAFDNLTDESKSRRELQWKRPVRIDESGLPTGVITHDMSKIVMPIYPPDRNLYCTIDAQPYPGLDKEIVNCLDLSAQFVGSKFDKEKQANNYDSDISQNQLLHLWSAYRLVVERRKKIGEESGIDKQLYYLADLQGIVGCDVKKWKVSDIMMAVQLDVASVPLPETK